MANKVTLPADPDLAKTIIDAEAKERGLLGNVFGTRDHAPTNIAALAMVLLIILLGMVLFVPVAEGVERGALITTLLSTLTFVIGIIFGRRGGGD